MRIVDEAAKNYLDHIQWDQLLLSGEIPLYATLSARILAQDLLVVTSQRLHIHRTNSKKPPEILDLASLRVSTPDPLATYKVDVESLGKSWRFHISSSCSFVALCDLLPARDLLLVLEMLNNPRNMPFNPKFGEADMAGFLAQEIADLREEMTREAAKYAQISLQLTRHNGRFLPSIERELIHLNGHRDVHEFLDSFPLYVVEEALTWLVDDGQIVAKGQVIATLDDTLVKAPASGRVEIFDLQSKIIEEHDGYFSDEHTLEIGTWLGYPDVGRIHIDRDMVELPRPPVVEPPAMRIRNPSDAEKAAASWIRSWGWADALVTQAGADGGIDVESMDVVAQVKAHANPIGRPDIQNLYGIAQAEKRIPLFFSLSDYTTQALDWANKVGVSLFIFDLEGRPSPANLAARMLLHRQGWSEAAE